MSAGKKSASMNCAGTDGANTDSAGNDGEWKERQEQLKRRQEQRESRFAESRMQDLRSQAPRHIIRNTNDLEEMLPVYRYIGYHPHHAAHSCRRADRKSTRLNSSHVSESRMPSSA